MQTWNVSTFLGQCSPVNSILEISMAEPSKVELYCFGPGEIPLRLNAVISDRLDANILTQYGLQALQGIQNEISPTERMLYSTEGARYTVRDVVKLQIWRSREARSVKLDFHILLNNDTFVQRSTHAILAGNAFMSRATGTNGVPVAVTRVKELTEEDDASVSETRTTQEIKQWHQDEKFLPSVWQNCDNSVI
ncbi:hypothetical protein EYZ11_011688 [Aspergillus tanneri]|uniref:Uncharacterized protein n=1 Tax=Aspergillus tanneri TaxID=1220188 RepID=A0A4S3J257_9EURO|nr:hypothetical protein EYZ11_011688 [Aspergillus tanneri]